MLIVGCLPSIHKVVEILSEVSIGVSRYEIKVRLVKATNKELIESYQYPVEMSELNINDDKEMMAIIKREGGFICVYPPDLYDKMPKKAFFDMVGIYESNNGGGSLRIIYDNNTNYIGFFAESFK